MKRIWNKMKYCDWETIISIFGVIVIIVGMVVLAVIDLHSDPEPELADTIGTYVSTGDTVELEVYYDYNTNILYGISVKDRICAKLTKTDGSEIIYGED